MRVLICCVLVVVSAGFVGAQNVMRVDDAHSTRTFTVDSIAKLSFRQSTENGLWYFSMRRPTGGMDYRLGIVRKIDFACLESSSAYPGDDKAVNPHPTAGSPVIHIEQGNSGVSFSVNIDAAKTVRLRVYDMRGRVFVVQYGDIPRSENLIAALPPGVLSRGAYVVEATIDGKAFSRPLIVR